MGRKPKNVVVDVDTDEQDAQLPVKADDTAWAQEVAELRRMRDDVSGGILRYRYRTGLFAIDVAEARNAAPGVRKYGNHTVAQIAEELEDSESTIHSCMQFAKKFTQAELETMATKGWAWRAVMSLVTVEDPKQRAKFQLDYEKGKYANSDLFREAVHAVNETDRKEGTRTEKRGGGVGTTAQRVRGFNTVAAAMVSKTVPDFVAGVETFIKEQQEMSPSAAETISEQIETAKATLPELHKQLDRVEAVIKRSGV